MKDANAWREECNYISRVTGKKGDVPEMGRHNTPADRLRTFIDYCKMQQEVAKRDGFDDVVQYIQHVLDDLEPQ